jgi:flagellar L-ring protein precursor FlgH
MKNTLLCFALPLLVSLALPAQTPNSEEALNRYLEESLSPSRENLPSPGSLFSGQSFLAELARDPRAATVGDLVTVLVLEQASALSSGSTSSSRASDSNHSITNFLGVLNPAGRLANLAASTGDSSLDGQGTTSRQTQVTTTLTAYVTQVMPNGNLVIEGLKEVAVNSERQTVWLRGVVRPTDLSQANGVRSDRVALMELRVNGKGVVNDAIRRPNAIYRFLKAILPF